MKKLNLGDLDDTDLNPESDFEVVAVFDAQFHGFCAVDRGHVVKRGDRVSKVQHADNPMVPVAGVACKACTWALPRATEDSSQV